MTWATPLFVLSALLFSWAVAVLLRLLLDDDDTEVQPWE